MCITRKTLTVKYNEERTITLLGDRINFCNRMNIKFFPFTNLHDLDFITDTIFAYIIYSFFDNSAVSTHILHLQSCSMADNNGMYNTSFVFILNYYDVDARLSWMCD